MVLLAVLIVVVLLSLAAYGYSDLMLSEYRTVDSSNRAAQSRAFADSGVAYVAAMLADPNNSTVNGNPYNNPTAFQDVLVPSSNPNARPGRFTIVALRRPQDIANGGQPWNYGVLDESSKINLNALMQLDASGNIASQMLQALPNMTQDMANAILDWLDADESPRQNGAESDSYATMSPAYQSKNGPLDSVEELLLVKGITPQLLFGNDRNRNGSLDPGEDDGSGAVDMGWSAYLTLYSRETNVASDGTARIWINDQDLSTLSNNLTSALGNSDLVSYIIAYRMYGGSQIPTTSGGGGGGGTSSGTPSTPTVVKVAVRLSGATMGSINTQITSDRGNATSSKRQLQNIQSLWDLVNSQVSVPVQSGNTTTNQTLPSPLNDPGMQAQLLPVLFDKCTTKNQAELPARININTTSQVVLQALQSALNLADADVQAIQSSQPDPNSTTAIDTSYNSPAWLMTKANLPQATCKKLEQYVTTRTQVYRFQAIGYYEKGGPVSRVEAVVDTNQGRPRIVYWRDLGELGRAFDLNQLRGK
jgi:type II secretory pathway component PulK